MAIVDLRMPDTSGMDVLARCREIDPAIATFILTAYGTVDAVAGAFKLGAKDFLAKPIRRDDLLAAISRALDSSRLAREARTLQERFRATSSFNAIVGESRNLREALDLAAKAAVSDISVVICGETGTGKELVAAAIHEASPRGGKSMVTAVIAAGPNELQKSALFGHVKGAFTGADSSRRGYFQQADGSTLFLDEIGDVSLETQVGLLRAIEQKRVRPVGAEQEIAVDVRIICATLKNLRAEVEAGRFREDLYYRLGGVFVELPSLRDRPDDVPRLAAHFVQRFVKPGQAVPDIEPEALESLLQYDWPGNVRELRNVLERAVLLSADENIRAEHCFMPSKTGADRAPEDYSDLSLREASDCFTADYLRRLMDRYGGNTQKVADHAGIHVTSVRRRLREFRISR